MNNEQFRQWLRRNTNILEEEIPDEKLPLLKKIIELQHGIELG